MTKLQFKSLSNSTSLRRRTWLWLCLAIAGLCSLLDAGGIPGVQGAAAIMNDPIYAQQAKLTLNNGAANDLFGNSVALSGDWAVFVHAYAVRQSVTRAAC